VPFVRRKKSSAQISTRHCDVAATSSAEFYACVLHLRTYCELLVACARNGHTEYSREEYMRSNERRSENCEKVSPIRSQMDSSSESKTGFGDLVPLFKQIRNGIATGWTAFGSRQGQEIFLYSTASRRALGPNFLSNENWSLFPLGKAAGA
jgi:hypothetical protein